MAREEDVTKKIYKMAFGRVISAIRKSQFTQVEFSEITGIKQPTLSRIERGLTLPNVLDFKIIAQELGTTIGHIDKAVDEVLKSALEAAEKIVGTKSATSTENPWGSVVGVAGVAAIGELIGFAVAADIPANKRELQVMAYRTAIDQIVDKQKKSYEWGVCPALKIHGALKKKIIRAGIGYTNSEDYWKYCRETIVEYDRLHRHGSNKRLRKQSATSDEMLLFLDRIEGSAGESRRHMAEHTQNILHGANRLVAQFEGARLPDRHRDKDVLAACRYNANGVISAWLLDCISSSLDNDKGSWALVNDQVFLAAKECAEEMYGLASEGYERRYG